MRAGQAEDRRNRPRAIPADYLPRALKRCAKCWIAFMGGSLNHDDEGARKALEEFGVTDRRVAGIEFPSQWP